MLSVEGVKGIVLSALFLLTLLFSLIPVKLINALKKRAHPQHRQENSSSTDRHEDGFSTEHHDSEKHDIHPMFKRVISLLSCFAGGVFLATCFLDLLPSVRKIMVHVLYKLEIYTGFPVSEFVMVFGFFVILTTEQIVLHFKEGSSTTDVKKPLLANEDNDEDTEHSLAGIQDESIQEERRCRDNHSSEHSHNVHSSSSLRSFILLIALSLHSVFEGLAVGLQKTSGDVLGIFSALVLHKSILGFSLGLSLVQSRLSQKLVVQSVLIFSLSAPLGVGVGMGIINLWDSITSSLVQGVLSGIATGTFLYVTFFEVLPHEFNAQQDRLLKVIFLILGYSCVTGILFLSNDVKKPFCVVESLLNN